MNVHETRRTDSHMENSRHFHDHFCWTWLLLGFCCRPILRFALYHAGVRKLRLDPVNRFVLLISINMSIPRVSARHSRQAALRGSCGCGGCWLSAHTTSQATYDPRRVFRFSLPRLEIGPKTRSIGTYLSGGLVSHLLASHILSPAECRN